MDATRAAARLEGKYGKISDYYFQALEALEPLSEAEVEKMGSSSAYTWKIALKNTQEARGRSSRQGQDPKNNPADRSEDQKRLCAICYEAGHDAMVAAARECGLQSRWDIRMDMDRAKMAEVMDALERNIEKRKHRYEEIDAEKARMAASRISGMVSSVADEMSGGCGEEF